jgi:6-pyruvoyltetrahydropterin/6-carboxytetrahydropterin synthase
METVSTNTQNFGNPMKTSIDIFDLSQRFYFEAAHTLHRTYETEGSLRIHGHTYEAEVTVSGLPNPESGMIVDLTNLRNEIERVKSLLDHQFLDEVEGLGPATLENLSLFIRNQMLNIFPNLSSVMVERRASGDRCLLRCSQ